MDEQNKLSELDELFQLKYHKKINQLNEVYRIKLNTQKEIAAKNGTLESGSFANQFVQTELERAKELSQFLFDTFKSVYCNGKIDSENEKAFLKRLEKWRENNFKGFCSKLESEHCIPLFIKSQLQSNYQRQLNKIANDLISSVKIDLLESKRSNITEKKNHAEPPSFIKNVIWMKEEWKNRNKKIVFFTILFILVFIIFNVLF